MTAVASVGPLALAALSIAAAALVLPHPRASTRLRLGVALGTSAAGPGSAGVTPSRVGTGGPAVVAGRSRWSVERMLPTLCGLAVGSLLAVLIGGGSGIAAGTVTGALTAFGARRWAGGVVTEPPTEPLRLAGAWDLLAACLRAGLPVATSVHAVAGQLPGSDGRLLRRVAALLATGAEAGDAWEPALASPSTAALARTARRTARSGAAMAGAVTELAAQLRAGAADLAEERAQRAGVLITGPLGLCFLPAFFCLGVLPVVIGLADQLTTQW